MTHPENDLRDAVARDYVLVKRGLYYAPNNLGYVGVLDDAGRYTEEDVKRHAAHGNDVRGILAADAHRFSEKCWPDTVTRILEADLAKARADLERVTAERDTNLTRLATMLVEAERAEADAEAICEASHRATCDAVAASVEPDEMIRLIDINRRDRARLMATLAPRQRAQEMALAFVRALAALNKAPAPKEPA